MSRFYIFKNRASGLLNECFVLQSSNKSENKGIPKNIAFFYNKIISKYFIRSYSSTIIAQGVKLRKFWNFSIELLHFHDKMLI